MSLSVSLYRNYHDIPLSKTAQVYTPSFLKELDNYIINHNGFKKGHRRYIYLDPKYIDTEMSVHAYTSTLGMLPQEKFSWLEDIRAKVCKEAILWCKVRGIKNYEANVLKNLLEFEDKNHRTKSIKISRLIQDQNLLNEYSQMLNLRVLENKKLLLCISDHPYDIVSMSTGRSWTSCMNIISGQNKEYVPREIFLGTLVVYIIYENDLNLNNPIGRLLLKPWYMNPGEDKQRVVYFPERTTYSSYLGLYNAWKSLKEISENIYKAKGDLFRVPGTYIDTHHDGIEVESINGHGKYLSKIFQRRDLMKQGVEARLDWPV